MTTLAPPATVTAQPVVLLLHTVECVVCQRTGGLLDPVLRLVHHVDAEGPCELPGREA